MDINGFNDSFLGNDEKKKAKGFRGGKTASDGILGALAGEDVDCGLGTFVGGLLDELFGGMDTPPASTMGVIRISGKVGGDSSSSSPELLDNLKTTLCKLSDKALKTVSEVVTDELRKRGLVK